jgi:hypothetical protein
MLLIVCVLNHRVNALNQNSKTSQYPKTSTIIYVSFVLIGAISTVIGQYGVYVTVD